MDEDGYTKRRKRKPPNPTLQDKSYLETNI